MYITSFLSASYTNAQKEPPIQVGFGMPKHLIEFDPSTKQHYKDRVDYINQYYPDLDEASNQLVSVKADKEASLRRLANDLIGRLNPKASRLVFNNNDDTVTLLTDGDVPGFNDTSDAE